MFTWVTSSSGELTVTITANAITLNAAAAVYFSDIRYVMIGIDAQDRRIAIRPVRRREIELDIYPKESLYKLTVGKGYARVTSKKVVAQISEEFGYPFENEKMKASYDQKDHLLIAQFKEKGDEV